MTMKYMLNPGPWLHIEYDYSSLEEVEVTAFSPKSERVDMLDEDEIKWQSILYLLGFVIFPFTR